MVGDGDMRHCAQQAGQGDDREFARGARGCFEATVHSFCFRQLTDMPQQERRQRMDEQQRMQAPRSKRERLNSSPMPKLCDLLSRKFSSICMRCA